jgi:hypothetical protein
LPFWFAVLDTTSAFFLFPFFFSGRFAAGVKMPSEIFKILQPVKMKSNGRVIGYFYRMKDDGTLQYVSFASSVDSIEADKVEAATPAELEATKQRQREAGARG